MLTLSFILVGLFLVLIQTTLFMPSPLWLASPDFYYILVGYLAYNVTFLRGILVLLPVSMVLDIYSGTIIGMYPTLCYLGYFLLKFMVAKMPVRKSLYQLPLVAISYLFVNWILLLALGFFQPQVIVGWEWLPILFRSLLIYIFSFPLFRFFTFLEKRFRGKFSSPRLTRSLPGNQFRRD
jgi:rod shape-determining protein MreD